MTPVDTITQWREDWSSASVVNHTIVTESTVRQPGFDLSDSLSSYIMVSVELFPGRSRSMLCKLNCTDGVSRPITIL